MREIGEQITAARAAAVIHETFGHLDAKPGERHKGWFVLPNMSKSCCVLAGLWCPSNQRTK